VSAQVDRYAPPALSSDNVTPVAYQQPVAGEENTGTEPRRQGTSSTAPSPAADPGPMPLKPRMNTDRDEKPKSGLQSVVTVGGSLAAVLGIFFLVVWLLRRATPGGMGSLPGEVFEVLGRAPLANHQHVQLVRCGGKLLLVSVHATSGGVRTLTEITDRGEVDRLIDLCRQVRGNGRGATLRQALRQVEGDHA
jgi:flagellar biogenesis protein FliO